MHRDFDPDNPHPRANRTWKWKHILNKLARSRTREEKKKDRKMV